MKNTILEHKGFRAQIMKAPRLKGTQVHDLPPGTAIEVHATDEFEHPLPHWLKGPGNFVVPVGKEDGLWFDFRLSDSENTAVVLSIKGMNPISGKRSNGFSLERYETRCPVHDLDFEGIRFCKECGYKWPAQNYIAAPNIAWFDGFFTNGKVRQFFFTEDMARSIPEHVIGKEDTVPAFGFAFYRTKVYRPSSKFKTRDDFDKWYSTININNVYNIKPYYHYWSNGSTGSQGGVVYGSNTFLSNTPLTVKGFKAGGSSINDSENINAVFSSSVGGSLSLDSAPSTGTGVIPTSTYATSEENEKYRGVGLKQKPGGMEAMKTSRSTGSLSALNQTLTSNVLRSVQAIPAKQETEEVNMDKEVGVGAGAEVNQDIQLDPLPLSGWEEEPASVMRIYFVFEDQLKQIMAKGIKNLVGNKEGYLSGLPVG
jgi:hypothetical protein